MKNRKISLQHKFVKNISFYLFSFVLSTPLISLHAQNNPNNSSVSETQEKMTISGIVLDSKKDPLIGVSVVIKGTTKGTITDFNGKFSLTIPKG